MAEPRREVRLFAQAMEQQLQANDHKPGWKSDSRAALYLRLLEEAGELSRAMERRFDRAEIMARRYAMEPEPDIGEILKEAADVANFAMMLADVCGALVEFEPLRGGKEGA